MAEPARSSGAVSFTATKFKTIDEHTSSVFDLAPTAEGKQLLSVGTDGKVFLWDTSDWKKIAESDAPQKKSLGVRVSPDGKYAFTASDPQEVLIFKLPGLKLLHRVKLDMARTSNISCSSRLPMLAAAGHGPFALVGINNGKVVRDVPCFKTRSRVLWSRDGMTLYIGGDTEEGAGYELHKWSIRHPETERICSLPAEPYEMKWGKNDNELLLASGEYGLVVNVDNGATLNRWKSPDGKIVADFQYWPRHDVYLTGTKGGNVDFWKSGVATPVSSFVATKTQVHHIVPVGDDQLAVALQQSGNSLTIFKLTWTTAPLPDAGPGKRETPPAHPASQPGQPAGTSGTPAIPVGPSHLSPLRSLTVDTPFSRSVAFNANNKVLAVGLANGGMAFFDPKTGSESQPRLNSGPQQYISLVSPHPVAGLFVLQEAYGAMSFYDWKHQKRIRPGGSGGVTGCVAWSPNGKFIFSGTQSGFDAAVFDFSKRHAVMTIEEVTSLYGSLTRGLAVSPRNVVATMRADGKVQYYKHVRELSWEHEGIVTAHSGGGSDIRMINGMLCSLGREGDLKMWKVGASTPTRTISLHGKFSEGRFLSDNLIGVVRDRDPQLELHAVDTASDKTKLQGVIPIDPNSHEATHVRPFERITNRVALSGDGKLLAAASRDGNRTKISLYDTSQTANPNAQPTPGGDSKPETTAAPQLTATRTVRLETRFVRGLAFNSSNGALAALGETSLEFLNARTGKTIGKAAPPTSHERRFVAPHPNPRIFFVADGLHFFKLIDAQTGQPVREHNAAHHFSGAANWSRDGKWLVYTHDQAGSVMSADLTHNVGLNEMDFKFSESDRIASAAAFSPRGDLIAMLRVDGRLLLFKNTGERMWDKQPARQAHNARGADVTFVGNEIATIGVEGKIHYWLPDKTEPIRTISLRGEVQDARFLNEKLVAVVRGEEPVLELHLLDAKTVDSWPASVVPIDSSFHSPVQDRLYERLLNRVAISHDNRVLAACSTVEGATEVAFYDLTSLKQRQTKRHAGQRPYRNWISADGKYKIEAALLEVKNGIARLQRKSDGQVLDVPLNRLSRTDQAFIDTVNP